MKPRSVMLVGLAAAFLCTAPARAEHMGHGPMDGGPGMLIPLLVHGSDLTADQQQKVQAIMSTNRDAMHTLFGQLRDANNQLADKLLGSTQPQTADLTPLVQQVATLRSQLMQNELNTVLAIRAVLTPDQLAKAATRKAQLKQLRQQMRALFDSPE